MEVSFERRRSDAEQISSAIVKVFKGLRGRRADEREEAHQPGPRRSSSRDFNAR
jgi:hypothetical protein